MTAPQGDARATADVPIMRRFRAIGGGHVTGLGRFMQTDPSGYGDGINRYDYVGGDPVNAVDPDGLLCDAHHTSGGNSRVEGRSGDIVVTATAFPQSRDESSSRTGIGGTQVSTMGGGRAQDGEPGRSGGPAPQEGDIVVTANRHR